VSEQDFMPAIEDLHEALCSLCWVAIQEATQSISGYDTQACPHCQGPYTRYRKLKDDRTSPYGNFMEAMCTPCAVARGLCQFCESPAE